MLLQVALFHSFLRLSNTLLHICNTFSLSIPLLMDIRLSPCLDYCKQCCNEHGAPVSFQMMVFSGYRPRSGIVRSYGSSIFSSSLPVCNSSRQCLFLFLYFLCINECIRLPSFSHEGQRAIETLLHFAFFTSLHILEITPGQLTETFLPFCVEVPELTQPLSYS